MKKNNYVLYLNIKSFLALSLSLSCLIIFTFAGCSKPKTIQPVDNTPIKKVRDLISKGDYESALKASREISNQIPPSEFTQESLYLQSYILAFARSDFRMVRLPLKQLLDSYPSGQFAPLAQKLLADCQYWQGNYGKALKEYKNLSANYGGEGFDSYALYQGGNCLLLDDKVSDALNDYRELVEKYPTDPLADSAQLMIANTYLKLQNYKLAKTELRKLVGLTHNESIEQASQKALRQLEEEEPLRKDLGVSE